jgi:hypothetical protein
MAMERGSQGGILFLFFYFPQLAFAFFPGDRPLCSVMFGRKTPFHCYNMYLTAALFLSLVYMVMVSLLYGLLWRWLFCLFVFTICFLPLSFLSFLFGGSIDSVLGIRVGGVLLFFTMSCKTTR